MSNSKLGQKGFSAVEGVIILVVVGLIGLVGWYVYTTQSKQQDSQTSAPATSQSEDKVPEVNSSGDLQAAEEFVNETDVDKALDTSEIDSALSE